MINRYFIYMPKHERMNPEPSFEFNRPALFNRKCCSILDRSQTEDNPDYPGRRRYKVVESSLTYLDAYPKMKRMNHDT